MLLADANVLLYAVDETGVHHDRARSWLDAALSGSDTVALAWVALLAFIRVGTHPSIMLSPMTVDEAMGQVQAWLGAPATVVVAPGTRHADLLRGLLRESRTAGNLTTDAHLAALALEHGADIVSFDRDFGRFAGVRHRLPG